MLSTIEKIDSEIIFDGSDIEAEIKKIEVQIRETQDIIKELNGINPLSKHMLNLSFL